MWLVAWKLVSNDAKRTVAPPNAKHSTLPQGCFFMFFVFDYIHDSATIHNLSPAKKPKVTMFAVEMWFGVGDGVECGRSTGLCPLPLGVPRCVIHDKKNVGTKFLVILKKK